MSKALTKAKEIISLIEQGQPIEFVKASTSATDDEWHRFSNKAYSFNLEEARKERKKNMTKSYGSTTSNAEISSLLILNETLADYALSLHTTATTDELKAVEALAKNLPDTESQIIKLIGGVTFSTRIRSLQKKGRIDKFDCFKLFSRIIDAALICYYRMNFISCYLTLMPVIEGIIIRWMGYKENETKPEFEDIRKFFKKSAERQPCPSNIQFHHVFIKVCDKILNNHFYKPTTAGSAYSDFNRHVASHLLSDNQFATKENCIRLFVLLDTMTEIYLYESRDSDPRFHITHEEIANDILNYGKIVVDNLETTPEHLILNISKTDLNL